jgi:excisionase family DNA binding protein
MPVLNNIENNNLNPLLKLNEAAKLLNVSPWTLRLWDNNGKLKAVRIGTRKDRRYRKEDILVILKEGME